MQILIHTQGHTVSEALRDFIERKLAYAVGRFAGKIARVNIRLKDTNGPRGGVDQHCRVEIALSHKGAVAAEATELDIYTSIKVAVTRAARRVKTTLDRKRTTRTRRSGHLALAREARRLWDLQTVAVENVSPAM